MIDLALGKGSASFDTGQNDKLLQCLNTISRRELLIMGNTIQEPQSVGYYQCQRHEMLPFIPAGAKRILDIGCGEARFSQLIKSQYSTEVWGVEVNEHAAAVASQHLDHVLCQPFSADIDLPKNYFDCIIFNDVLEHLVDPFAALAFSHQLLNDGGVVVCSIPNIRYFHIMMQILLKGEWQYQDSGVLDRTHLRFFTRLSILRTFDELNYEVELIKGINPSPSFKLNLLNRFLLGRIDDMRYMQFAVVARPC